MMIIDHHYDFDDNDNDYHHELLVGESPSGSCLAMSKAATCITKIDRWMNSNRLKLNSDKTQVIWLGSRHEMIKVSIDSIHLGLCAVKFRDLGVVIDSQLSMKDHVQKVCKTSYYHLRQLRSIRGSLSADSCSALVQAFISSRLDYCNNLQTGIYKSQENKLQSVLWVVAHLRKGKFKLISDDIRDKLHWLPVQQRIRFKIGVLVYRCLHVTAPSYLAQLRTGWRSLHLPHMGTSFFHISERLDSAYRCSLFWVPLSGIRWGVNSKIPIWLNLLLSKHSCSELFSLLWCTSVKDSLF